MPTLENVVLADGESRPLGDVGSTVRIVAELDPTQADGAGPEAFSVGGPTTVENLQVSPVPSAW